MLVNDFRVTLWLQTIEDEFYPILAFAKDLKDVTDSEATGIAKLDGIMSHTVKVTVNPGSAEGMSDILTNIEIIQ